MSPAHTIARRRLLLEELERRVLLSATNPFANPVFTGLPAEPHLAGGMSGWGTGFHANGDAYNDLAIYYYDAGNPPPNSHVAVLLGQANGAMTLQSVADLPGKVKTAEVIDLNGDSKGDLVVHSETYTGATATAGYINIYRNNGDGSFTHQGSQISVPVGASLDIFDMNGDGKLDLWVRSSDSTEVDVRLGNGAFGFAAAAHTSFGAGKTISFHTDDLNGDNIADIILNYPVQSGSPFPTVTDYIIEVHLGQASGAYGATSTWTDQGHFSRVEQVVELSSDTRPDLFVYRPTSLYGGGPTTVLVFRNNGDATFTQSWSKTLNGGYSIGTDVADVNKDGLPDLVIQEGSPVTTATQTVHVEHNQGNAVFANAQTLDVNDLSRASVSIVTDVDHDTYPDLVAYILGYDEEYDVDNWGTMIFFNNQSGVFSTVGARTFKPSAQPSSLFGTVFDINNDNLMDVVFTNLQRDENDVITSDQAWVYMNSTGRTFGAMQTTEFGAATALDYVLFDLDGDGIADPLPYYDVQPGAGGQSDETAGGFTFWKGAGDGTFTSATPVTMGQTPGRIDLWGMPGDYESDGDLDLLFLGTNPLGVYVVLNGSGGGSSDTTRPAADLADPANGSSISLSTLNGRHYIDVTFSDAGGSGLNTATITDSGHEFTLSGAAASGVTVSSGVPTLVSGTTYRYALTGNFTTGTVSVNFLAGAWADQAGNTNLGETESFTATDAADTTRPTANLSDPANNSSITMVTLNGRGYIDVTFSDTGSGLNTSTITDSGPEFTLSGSAAGGVSLTSGVPTLVSGTTYRYTFSGAFTAGTARVNFIAGAWADQAGNTNLAETEDFTVVGDTARPTASLAEPLDGAAILAATLNGRGYIDVTFDDAGGSGLNTATITDNGQEFTLTGTAAAGVTVNGVPTLVSGTTYRYTFTGLFGVGLVTVNFTAGTWADQAGNTNLAETESFTASTDDDLQPVGVISKGSVQVFIYDVIGAVDVTAANVKVSFGANNSISSIALSGTEAMEGLGLVVSGATSVGTISDSRKTPGSVAFIASSAAIKSVTLKSGITGYNFNGMTLAGQDFAADLDGDGITDDATALYSPGAVSAITLAGPLGGDTIIAGADAKGVALTKLTIKNGGMSGGLAAAGDVKAVAITGGDVSGRLQATRFGTVAIATGDFSGQLISTAAADPAAKLLALSSVTIKGGNFEGVVQANGHVGTISTASAKVEGIVLGGSISGATINAAAVKTLKTAGNLQQSVIQLSQVPDAKIPALGTLTVAGWLDHSRIEAAGNVGAAAVGLMSHSTLFAGVTNTFDNNSDGVRDLPTPPNDFSGNPAVIKSFNVKGIAGTASAFINSTVAAWEITSASLNTVQTVNSGTPFGLAMHTYNALKFRDGTTTRSFSKGAVVTGLPGDLEFRVG